MDLRHIQPGTCAPQFGFADTEIHKWIERKVGFEQGHAGRGELKAYQDALARSNPQCGNIV